MLRAPNLIEKDINSKAPDDIITLNYDDRYRRRIVMKTDNGIEFLLDLQKTTELTEGDFLVLEDGRVVEIKAAKEELMQVSAAEVSLITKAAWHIGNRHLPCEIYKDQINLRFDHVIKQMLEGLGLIVKKINKPFNPEGGAYGQGRTQGHQH